MRCVIGVTWFGTGGIHWLDEQQQTELYKDAVTMVQAGLSVVRLFVPAANLMEQRLPATIDQVRAAVDAAQAAGLSVIISAPTFWMNGMVLPPADPSGVAVFENEASLEQAEAMLRGLAAGLRDCSQALIYDLGDEIFHARRSTNLPVVAVRRWFKRMTSAVRSQDPGAVVMQCHDAGWGTNEGRRWLLAASPVDLIGVHAFPLWSPMRLESHADRRATMLLPFLVAVVAAWQRVVVDELTCYGAGEPETLRYARAVIPACMARGAESVLWWCYKDIESRRPPYTGRPSETDRGLVRRDGTPRTVFETIRELAAGELIAPRRATAALVLSEPSDERRSYLSPGLDPLEAEFTAHEALTTAHIVHDVRRLNQVDGYDFLVCPGMTDVSFETQDILMRHVRDGGDLLVSLGGGAGGIPEELLDGLRCVDFRRDFSGVFRIGKDVAGEVSVPELAVLEGDGWSSIAHVDNIPAMWYRTVGNGHIVVIPWWPEATVGTSTLRVLYDVALARMGQRSTWNLPDDVEVLAVSLNGRPAHLLINHDDARAHELPGVEVPALGPRYTFVLEADA